MAVLFSGIPVPKEVRVEKEYIEKNHHELVYMGETFEYFIMRGVALTAFWGTLLREHRFIADFTLGIYKKDMRIITHFRPDSEDFCNDREQDSGCVTVGKLDEEMIMGIQAVSGFYGIDPTTAMSTGIHMRGQLLRGWEQGNRFAYSDNGRNWYVYEGCLDPWEL